MKTKTTQEVNKMKILHNNDLLINQSTSLHSYKTIIKCNKSFGTPNALSIKKQPQYVSPTTALNLLSNVLTFNAPATQFILDAK